MNEVVFFLRDFIDDFESILMLHMYSVHQQQIALIPLLSSNSLSIFGRPHLSLLDNFTHLKSKQFNIV